jgi:type IV fimbrial biogenesis protein FimT
MNGTTSAMILRRDRGFTAIELLVVLALIAVFVALALPSFEGAVKRNRVSTAASEIINVLQFARAEAIRTRQAVTVVQTNTSANCIPAAGSPNTADWSCGIEAYADANNNGVRQTTEPMLKAISATDFKGLTVQLVLITNPVNGSANITYDPLGFFQDGNPGDVIYIWPTSSSDIAATSAYTNTICFDAGGEIKVVSAYTTNTVNKNACSSVW